MTALGKLAFAVLSAAAAAQAQSVLETKTYTNAALHFSLEYPAELETEQADITAERSYRSRFALHPAYDPDHSGADPCSPLLLALGTGPDRPADPKAKPNPKKQIAILPTGGIALSEIKHTCIANDTPGTSDEDAMTQLVEGLRDRPGFTPLGDTASYKVQGATVILAAASGASPNDKGKRTGKSGFTYMASVGAVFDGHLLLFSITANDLALLNHLMHLSACFAAPACADGFALLVPNEIGKSKE